MRTRIISGIVGAVACTAFAIGTASPATAAEEHSDVVGGLLGVLHVPQAPCIDCW